MVAIVIVAAFAALGRDIARRLVSDPSPPKMSSPFVYTPSGKVILNMNPRGSLRRFQVGQDIPLDGQFMNDSAEAVTVWSARAT